MSLKSLFIYLYTIGNIPLVELEHVTILDPQFKRKLVQSLEHKLNELSAIISNFLLPGSQRLKLLLHIKDK